MFSTHVIASQWDGNATCALVLERANESFDDRDAAALSDGAEPRLDAFTLALGLESVAPELRALVTDDVLRLGVGIDAAKEGPNPDRLRLFLEDGDTHGPA